MPSSLTARAVPVLAAVGANIAVFAVGRAGDASFVVAGRDSDAAPMVINAAIVAVSTLVPLVVALLATALIARRWPRAVARLRIVAMVLTVLSVAGPLTADTDTATRLLLAVMHLVVGAAYVAATRTSATTRDAEARPITGEPVASSH